MATKKQNRRDAVRRFRRAFNRMLDVGAKISGRRIHRHKYGAGIGGRNNKSMVDAVCMGEKV